MDELIEQFTEIRGYLVSHLKEMVDVYLTGMWDPLVKFVIIKETNKLIEDLLICKYPDFPMKYLPKVKFRIYDEEQEIEAGVQTYLNTTPDSIFLGTRDLGDSMFDFYIYSGWDPSCEYTFIAKYGHSLDNQYSGSKVAAAEYFNGTVSPLSVAFSMAVEDGFIS